LVLIDVKMAVELNNQLERLVYEALELEQFKEQVS
jgi:hypothetical protein